MTESGLSLVGGVVPGWKHVVTRYPLARILRRHGVLFGALIVLAATLVAVQAAHPPTPTPRATTSIVILPDPRPPISWETPVLPPYQTFQTKLGSIESGVILRRSAEIALGERPFLSSEWSAEHFAPKIEAGVHATRIRYGTGRGAVLGLADVLERRLETRHLERQQIAEIELDAETPLEAMFLTWAVAEAAHQHHGERMRREIHEVRARLADEIAAARGDLLTILESRDEFVETEALELDMRRRLMHQISTELAREGMRLEVALSMNRAGFPMRRIEAPNEILAEKATLIRLWTQEQIALSAGSALLGAIHPQMRLHERRMREIERRIRRNETRRPVMMGQIVQASLNSERHEMAIDLAVLSDQQEWFDEAAREWNRRSSELRMAGRELGKRREEFQSLMSLDNKVRSFGQSLGSPVMLLSPASSVKPRSQPVNPLVALGVTLLFTVFGLLGLGMFLDRVSAGLRTRRDVEDGLSLPLLGVVPDERKLPHDLLGGTQPTPATAGIDALAATLCDSAGSSRARTIAIASAEKNEGKTTLSIRLAAALARRGMRVALVDGDLRLPAIANDLGLPQGPGLGLCTVESGKPRAALRPHAVEGINSEDFAGEGFDLESVRLETTRIPNLDVLTSAAMAPSQLPILDESRLAQLLSRLRATYDLVIIDTPAISKAADALSIGRAADGVVLVAKSFATPRRAVNGARGLLEDAGATPVGVVLTRFPHTPAGAFAPEPEATYVLPTAEVDRTPVEA